MSQVMVTLCDLLPGMDPLSFDVVVNLDAEVDRSTMRVNISRLEIVAAEISVDGGLVSSVSAERLAVEHPEHIETLKQAAMREMQADGFADWLAERIEHPERHTPDWLVAMLGEQPEPDPDPDDSPQA